MRPYILFAIILFNVSVLSAQSSDTLNTGPADSVSISFTPMEAKSFILEAMASDSLWRPEGEEFRYSLSRLLDHIEEPIDSVNARLAAFNFDSVSFAPVILFSYDTLALRWFNDSTFIVDTTQIADDFLLIDTSFVSLAVDTVELLFHDRSEDIDMLMDSLINLHDTIIVQRIDTLMLDSLDIPLFHLVNESIDPLLIDEVYPAQIEFIADSSSILKRESIKVIMAEPGSPFYFLPNEFLPDSMQIALSTLLNYAQERDSIRILINDIDGNRDPLWLSNHEKDYQRFWVKNSKNDSLTIWVGNLSRHNISLLLEDDVNINRMEMTRVEHIPITRAEPELSLRSLEPLKTIPNFWEYDFASSFAFNQTYLSNWAKGGESSVSTVLDIQGGANYTNTDLKTKWISSGRLKYGSIITQQNGLRTNTDMLILNSQYNKVIWEKIDFTASFYMKNQVARGYNYPNDSVIVSKFLNPGTFTIGIGLEYKPFKNTVINFSPLSYKNTFVLDTTGTDAIDQTRYGIDPDKRAKQEMGGQLVFTNKLSVLDGLNIKNDLRLFSSYFNKPQNIDVDWELSLDRRITWYFSVAVNFHLISDKDILFPELDDDDQPVLLPDGSASKVPKLQFSEFLGLTFSFKF